MSSNQIDDVAPVSPAQPSGTVNMMRMASCAGDGLQPGWRSEQFVSHSGIL